MGKSSFFLRPVTNYFHTAHRRPPAYPAVIRYHLGMAYQIVDDILDFTGASATLGKPAQADMELGLATAPILYACEAVPELRPLILRKFSEKGDVQKAVALATATDCVVRSYQLAEFHAQRAVDALLRLPETDARAALLRLLHTAISRKS